MHLHGPLLPYPVIDFQSDGGVRHFDVGLVELPDHGRPGFDFSSNQGQVSSSFLAPTVSAFTSSASGRAFGSRIDVLQFQLGTAPVSAMRHASRRSAINSRNHLFGLDHRRRAAIRQQSVLERQHGTLPVQRNEQPGSSTLSLGPRSSIGSIRLSRRRSPTIRRRTAQPARAARAKASLALCRRRRISASAFRICGGSDTTGRRHRQPGVAPRVSGSPNVRETALASRSD